MGELENSHGREECRLVGWDMKWMKLYIGGKGTLNSSISLDPFDISRPMGASDVRMTGSVGLCFMVVL